MTIITSVFGFIIFFLVTNLYHVLFIGVIGENDCLDNFEQYVLANRRIMRAYSVLSFINFDSLVFFIIEVPEY